MGHKLLLTGNVKMREAGTLVRCLPFLFVGHFGS